MSRPAKLASISASMILPFVILSQQTGIQITPRDQSANMLLIQNEAAGLRGAMAFRITEIKPQSPADRAGLRPNDLILAVDDAPVTSEEALDQTLLQPWLDHGKSYVVTIGRFNPPSGDLEIMKVKVQCRER
jgi:S1-C subfamily serine protease